MNEELNKALVENSIKLMEAVNSVVDFVSQEAPPYVRELLEYLWWKGVIDLSVSLSLFIIPAVLIMLASRFFKKHKEYPNDEYEFWCGACLAIGGIALAIAFVSTVKLSERLIKLKVAPRVVVLEHLRGL